MAPTLRAPASPRRPPFGARFARWFTFGVLALIGHLLILLTVSILSPLLTPEPKSRPPTLQVVVLAPPEEPEEEPETPEVDWDGQVVEIAEPELQERPLDAEYLAEYNQRVEEETRVKEFRPNPEVIAKTFSPEDKLQLEDVEDVGATDHSTGAQVGNDSFEPDRDGSLAALPSPYKVTNKDGLQAPTVGSFSTQSITGSPSNDLLKEREGEAVNLNTKEFLYAAYINQIKRMVSFYWNQNLDNLGGQLMLTRPRYTTVVSVVIGPDGRLHDARVDDDSGAPPLDQAVISAFRLASPFPPPPEGLMERDGLAYLDRLAFTVEVGNGTARYMGVDPRAGTQFPGILKTPR
ncbi:TonB C-terminal domain-containing protein [Myxococcota bacterium]|nr:TonB C-terminal domain-containing protein [Myxococcota bacterium]